MTPEHYEGAGVSCADALRSMLDSNGDGLSPTEIYWWGSAFKYVWRWRAHRG